ncbi:Leucine-rich repeat, cysteine-containing subtype [Cynara cardunculus var. scolymus]|uniref:Leucine-rich repeat, cysteine-containing subtype n=1 Tax=Cynara cardunculus var. scolymus TaxID=59895 RepID=A0A103YBI3_CYNCS|nr:Leucine-rich repeat, cysteine-containing subtype [Cynara cardunculus var. scolymus]
MGPTLPSLSLSAETTNSRSPRFLAPILTPSKVEYLWGELVLENKANRSMKKVDIEVYLEDIPEMEARSGWEPLFIEQLLTVKRERRHVRPSWNCAFMKSVKYKIDQYGSFSMLPRDISQQIFNELVFSQRLIGTYLEAFRDCALQDIDLGEYPEVDDSWMEVILSQGSSLLSADLSGSDITDRALFHIKDCENIQALNFNFCDQISDSGLDSISGLSNLTTLSFKRNNNITAEGMSALSGLVNLLKLDLERCPGIHGGLVHLRGLSKLEALNLNCCNCITDADMEPLSELTNLKELQVSSSKVTDCGVAFLKGLHKLALLNMERCPVTAACLDSLSAIMGLLYLNLSRCKLTGNGCDKFSRLKALKVLNLGFNDVSDAVLVHLNGGSCLINLESLNLDSCRIRDDGLVNLAGGSLLIIYVCTP